ncbi:hypothetical protein BpHYR1_041127 [Brachionus plicatilis]|uniref:Uncharacterized protein n=1 Tax=Brachionus plicatilis TaxID=10195 RepID=A0A3M7S497_BRAPC|nr:hypothetical protein BpHYR1_041127 [Brachionus plicatilis]
MTIVYYGRLSNNITLNSINEKNYLKSDTLLSIKFVIFSKQLDFIVFDYFLVFLIYLIESYHFAYAKVNQYLQWKRLQPPEKLK